MRIAIGNDHVAIEMKKEIKAYLEGKGHEVIDIGTNPRSVSIIRSVVIRWQNLWQVSRSIAAC